MTGFYFYSPKRVQTLHSPMLRPFVALSFILVLCAQLHTLAQSQEWGYSLGQEVLSEPIILTAPSLGTDRLLAANIQLPSGVQDILLTRQDEFGTIVWQTRVDIGAKDQIGAMELITVGPLTGELILVGETDYLSSASAFLCRLDPNATGGPVVVDTFIDPFPSGGGSTTEGRYLDLTIREEGGALRIACAGWMGTSGPGASRSAVVSEFEIGAMGFVRLWSRKLDTNPQVDDHDMASTILHIPGDGYLIGGTLNGTTGFTQPCGAVHRLNYAGGTEWTSRLMGNSGTIAVADLAFLGQNGQVVALSNHTATETFGIHLLSYQDGFLQQAQVFDPNGPYAGLALAGLAMETVDPMGQFLLAGMAKDHIDPDYAGDQNLPFHMLIDVNENGILAGGDLILHQEFATDLGETVSGFSWFGNGTQPIIHHPDMVALGGGNDLILAACRSQFLPLSADLDVVPSNWAGDDGASCETLVLVPDAIPTDVMMEGESSGTSFDGPLTPTSGITLSTGLTLLDCDEITVPPCNLPSLILTSMDLDVVTAAAALAATPDADILFSWDFGDGSAPLAGLGLSSVTHEYDVAGEYTITLTSSCAWDASTTTSIQTTVSIGSGYCIEVEEVVLDNALIPELVPEGLSTYRYYVTCEHPGDRVVSLSTPAGSGIYTSTDFFQASTSFVLGSDVNPYVYSIYPDARYDSWLTIGLDQAPSSSLDGSPVSLITSASNQWQLNFEEEGAVEMADDIGGGLYTIFGDANQLCGADQRVLLAQLTTDGSITGDIDVQIIPDGTTQASLDGSTFDLFGIDLDGDGIGHVGDLLIFLGSYGFGPIEAMDINGNGVSDWDDLTKALAPNSMHVILGLDAPCEASSIVETCYPFFPTDLDFNFDMACDPRWGLVRFPEQLFELSESQLDCYVQIRGGLSETDDIRIGLDPSSVSVNNIGGFFRGRVIPLDWPVITDGSLTTFTYTAELKFYQEGAYDLGLEPCHVIEKTASCTHGVSSLWYARELLPILSVDLSTCAASASPLPPFVESRGLTYRIDELPDGVSEAQFMSAFEAGEDLSPYGAPLDSVELQPGIIPLDCGGFGYEMVSSRPVFTVNPMANGASDNVQYTDVATGETFSASEFEAVPRAIAIENPRIHLQALLVQPPMGSNDLTPSTPFGPFSALPSFGDDCTDLTAVSLGGQAIAVNPLLYAGGVNDWGDVSVTPDLGVNGLNLPDSLAFDNEGFLTFGQLAPSETLSFINTGTNGECPGHVVALATFSASIDSPLSSGGNNGIEGPCPAGYDCQGIGFTASTILMIEDMGNGNFDNDANDIVIQLQIDGAANAGPLAWSISNVENEVVATGQTAAGDSGGPLTLPGGSYTLAVDASCGAYTPQLSISEGTATQFGISTQLLAASLLPTIGSASFSFTVPGGLGIPLSTPWSASGCNAAFDHSTMPFGTYTPPPGTLIGQEDNIKLSMEVFNDGSGNIYNFGLIDMAPTGPLSGKAFHTSNVNAVYDLSAFSNVTEVSFDFYDGAGVENLRVNGGTWLIDEFELMAPGVAPGITMSVTTSNFAGYQTGTVTLTGNVQELWVGGQQFSVDNLCVKHDGTIVTATGPVCPAQCEGGSLFDALPYGEKYGDLPSGATTFVAIGDIAFDADGIPVSLHELTSSSGFPGYQYAHVDGPQSAYGFGGVNTLELRNVTASFDIASVYPETDTLCLHFLDEGGYENLSINGSTLTITANGKGGLAALDGTSLGGVDISVSGTPFTTGSGTPVAYAGILSLIGDVDELVIGGQEFWIDSLCIGIPGPSSPPSLSDFEGEEGEQLLLDLLDLAYSVDSAGCQLALSLDVASGFPTIDSAQVQFIGAQTGLVYALNPLDFSGGDDDGETGDAATAIEYGLIAAAFPIPYVDPDADEMMTMSISLFGSGTSTTLTLPSILFPGCWIPIFPPMITNCVNSCDHALDFGSVPSITQWGDVPTNSAPGLTSTFAPPGTVIHSEAMIDWKIDDLPSPFGGPFYNRIRATATPPVPFGTGNVLGMVESTVNFDLTWIATDTVCFKFMDIGGMDFLEINGVKWEVNSAVIADMVATYSGTFGTSSPPTAYGEFTLLPAVLGGVNIQVNGHFLAGTWPATGGAAGFTGRMLLTGGNVNTLRIGGEAMLIDDVCISAAAPPPPPPSLSEYAGDAGEALLASMLGVDVALDSTSCTLAAALDLSNPALPTVDAAELQLIGLETGTVYASAPLTGSNGSDNDGSNLPPSHGGELAGGTGLMPHFITFDGLAFIPIPPQDIEPMGLSLSMVEGGLTIVVDFPGLSFPGCGPDVVIDACAVDADFAAFSADCGTISVVATSPGTGIILTWTVDGEAFNPSNPVAWTTSATAGFHTVCLTAQDPTIPNCSETLCIPVFVQCDGDCEFGFNHESMPLGPLFNGSSFTENNITLTVTSTVTGIATVDYAPVQLGASQALSLGLGAAGAYDLSSFTGMTGVSFQFHDLGEMSLAVEGIELTDDLASMNLPTGSSSTTVIELPTSTGGGTVTIEEVGASTGDFGTVTIAGSIAGFSVEGVGLIDNVCVTAEGVLCDSDVDEDGVCDGDETPGCTNPAAANYDPSATDDDGSCGDVVNCGDEDALNFSPPPAATGPCAYPSKMNLKMRTDCAFGDSTMLAGALSSAFIREELLVSLAPGTALRMVYSDGTTKAVPTDLPTIQHKQFTNPFGPYNAALEYQRPLDTAWTAYGTLSELCASNFVSQYTRSLMGTQMPTYSIAPGGESVQIHPAPDMVPASAWSVEISQDYDANDLAEVWSTYTVAEVSAMIASLDPQPLGSADATEPVAVESNGAFGPGVTFSGWNRPVEFRNYGVDANGEDGAIQMVEAPVNPAQTVLIRKMADMAPFRLDNEISNINGSNLSVMAAVNSATQTTDLERAGTLELLALLWEWYWDDDECETTLCDTRYMGRCYGDGEMTYITEVYCDCEGNEKYSEVLEEWNGDCCVDPCVNNCCEEDQDDDWTSGDTGDAPSETGVNNPGKWSTSVGNPNIQLVFPNPNCPCWSSESVNWASGPAEDCPCIEETGLNMPAPHPGALVSSDFSLDLTVRPPRVTDDLAPEAEDFTFTLDGKVLSAYRMNAATPTGVVAQIPLGIAPLGGLHLDFGLTIESNLYANSLRSLAAHSDRYEEFVFARQDTVLVDPHPAYFAHAGQYQELSRQRMTIPAESDSVVGQRLNVELGSALEFSDPAQNMELALYDFTAIEGAPFGSAFISADLNFAQEGLILNQASVRVDGRASGSPNVYGINIKTPAIQSSSRRAPIAESYNDVTIQVVVNGTTTFSIVPGEDQVLTQDGITATTEAAFCGVDVNSWIIIESIEPIEVLDIRTDDMLLLQEVGFQSSGDFDPAYFETWVPYGQDGDLYPTVSLSDAVLASDGAVVSEFFPGCTYTSATNFLAEVSVDDGTCVFDFADNPCPTDIDGDGTTNVGDLLELLGQFSVICDN